MADLQGLQSLIGESILTRTLPQEIKKQGYLVSQLDASFEKQGIFSSRNGAFSVEIAEASMVSDVLNLLTNAWLLRHVK